jgi:hypothetical protein
MSESAPTETETKWLRWGFIAAVIGVGVFMYRVYSTDIESAVEQAGGRVVWGERPTGVQKLITLIPAVSDPTSVDVWLGDTDVDDKWLRRHGHAFSSLPDDVELTLVRTHITDEGLIYLRDEDNITNMWLSETAVTDAGLDILCKYPNLETLSIDRTRITDRGLTKLNEFQKLWWLGLDSSQFTETGAAHLQRCAHLRWITLRDADNASVARLAQFPALEMIYLDGSGVTDASLPTIASMQKLQQLTLFDCEISDTGYASLRQALPRCSFARLTSGELEEMESEVHD